MKTGKHGPGRPPRPPLRRDRAFRAQLARQLGVEKPPQAFHAAMQKTLLELPEELPVRYRPVRELLRRTTMAAAVLALVFLGLLGVNSTYPQITEALPGLGFVFRSINGGQEAPPPSGGGGHALSYPHARGGACFSAGHRAAPWGVPWGSDR